MSASDPAPDKKGGAGSPAEEQPTLRTVAVIGGGPAGFAAARTLAAAGLCVSVFDRGRTPGGRASTRRSRSVEGVAFDHGAACFTATSGAFRAEVDEWLEAGVVGRWEGRFLRADPGGKRDESAATGDPARLEGPAVKWRPDPRERFVGVPSMASLVEWLAASPGIEGVHAESEIVELLGEPIGRGSAGPWVLKDAAGEEHGPFDAVVVAVAAPQAVRLLGEASPRLARLAERAKPAGSFSVMLAFDEELGLAPAAADVPDGAEPAPLEGVRLDRGPLAWAHREAAKPGRGADGGAECWVLQARPTWAASRLDSPAEEVIQPLKSAFERLAGCPLPATSYEAAHRWKFAHCVKPLPDASYLSPKHRLAACGDWFGGADGLGGVEAAVLSGIHAGLALAELAGKRVSASS